MASVVEKRPDGSALVVPAADAEPLQVGETVSVSPVNHVSTKTHPWPFGALAGKYGPFKRDEIEAARRDALLGETE